VLSRRARLAEAIVILAHAHWRSKQNPPKRPIIIDTCVRHVQSSLHQPAPLARFLAVCQLGLDQESGRDTTLSG
jgi:hypothetical protein